MLDIAIIKMLTVSGLILANVILVILTYMMLEEYIYWKGKDNDE